MAAKKLYENAAAHVEAGEADGSFVVVTKDDREVAYVESDEHGPDFALARAVDFADMMSRGVMPPSSYTADEAPAPSRRQKTEEPAAPKA